MTPPPPPVPRYGEASLADLASSMLAMVDVPGCRNPLGLEPANRACLLLVDGLGWELLQANRDWAPFLAAAAASGRPLTAGYPATTASSLGSLGTGRPPGEHGLVGCPACSAPSTACAGARTASAASRTCASGSRPSSCSRSGPCSSGPWTTAWR
jgi:hypothetical protein